MSNLRIVQSGKEPPRNEHNLADNFRSPDELQFGPPPSLLSGTITGLLGAAAGVVSLMLFFQLWQPEPYVSQEWLIFVVVGAVIGFYMRLERPFVEMFSQVNGEEPNRH